MSEQTGSWQPDPFGRHQYRYWNGSEWTDQVANDGVTSVDPPVAETGAGASAEPEAVAEPAAAEPVAEPTPADAGPLGDETVVAATPSEPSVPPVGAEPQTWAAPDATTAMPAAAPPPAAGAPGGPDEPVEPVATGGGGGSSNLPGIIVGVVILLALLGAAAWFLFLRDDDDDDARATVVAELRDDLGLTQAQANCVADELEDRVDMQRLADDIEADRDPSGAQTVAIMEAFDACNVDPSVLGGDSAADTTTSTTTGDGPSTGTSIPSALMDLFVQGILEESGLTESQGRCFAEEFLALDSVDFSSLLDDPEAFSEDMMGDSSMMMAFFEIFERCNIDPNDFDPSGGGSSGFQSGDTYGDNPVLDRLWDQCENGDGEACDELYFTSEVGSDYEEFGDTCGGRFPGGTVMCANEDLN